MSSRRRRYFCNQMPSNHIKAFFKVCLIFLCVPVLMSACSSKRKEAAAEQQKKGPRPPARVDAYVVQTSTVTESIELPGTIVADESTEIHPEVSGRIVGLYIREGAFVNKGALLAKLYDGDLQAQKRKLEVQLKIGQSNQNRSDQLLQIGGISRQDYDATTLNVSNTRADLDIIRTTIAKTEIRAPFSGKLGLKEVSTGAYVTPASIITTIQKTTALRLDFNVPEKYTAQIKKGQYVNFTVEGSNRKYTAVIMATESGIAAETRSLTIRAQVKGDATGLVPGGFAKVQLSFAPDNKAMLIPSQAVIPQARGKKVYVYRGGKASFVPVETGMRDSSNVQVTSGLNPGDTIIITGLLSLKPDADVKLNKVTN